MPAFPLLFMSLRPVRRAANDSNGDRRAAVNELAFLLAAVAHSRDVMANGERALERRTRNDHGSAKGAKARLELPRSSLL
jgi:hypothetical protein